VTMSAVNKPLKECDFIMHFRPICVLCFESETRSGLHLKIFE